MKQLFPIFFVFIMLSAESNAQVCEAKFIYKTSSNALVLAFTDSSAGTPVSWNWDFGDGYFSSKKNPQHAYSKGGVYPVCLIINTNSCADTLCKTIRVGCDTLKANFGYGIALTTVSFTDLSVAADSWKWDFGDGKTAVSENPVHTYTSSGTYTVCLTVSRGTCEEKICKTITVNDCRAAFYYNPDSAGHGVRFNNTSLGNAVSYMWYFGDGDQANLKDPSHVYDSAGTYTVCLVTQTSSCKDSVCKVIRAGTAECEAGFTISDSLRTCRFFNTSKGNKISKWQWDFGDGNTSQLPHPVHTYAVNGKYTVCLSLYSEAGCTDQFCKEVTVSNCFADFTHAPDSSGNGISFTSLSKGNIGSWNWDFGEGTNSSQPAVHHMFHQAGTYDVCLEIKTNNCTDRICKTIQVPGCLADFSYSEDSLNLLKFSAITKGKITKWQWDFGDGTASDMAAPAHTYTSPGSYVVCLKVWNDTLCSTSVCKKVTVHSCRPDFKFVSDSSGFVLSFSDLTQGKASNWQWDFNDGFYSSQQHPLHAYQNQGIYKVCLTVKGDSLCAGSVCKNVPVNVHCDARYTYKSTTGLSVAFTDSSQAFPSAWIWAFGDGDSAFVQNPIHTFKAEGTYVVCLIMKSDVLGCSDTYCKIIEVKKAIIPPDPCDAEFGYTILSKDANGTKVSFVAKGSSPLAQWNFGDSTTANGPVVVHTFANPGTHNVCLTVVSLSPPCYKNNCKKILITGTGAESIWQDAVLQVYPNPFSGSTRVECVITHNGNADLAVYDLLGKKVATLISGKNLKGQHVLSWNAENFPAGSYLLKLTGGENTFLQRIILLK